MVRGDSGHIVGGKRSIRVIVPKVGPSVNLTLRLDKLLDFEECTRKETDGAIQWRPSLSLKLPRPLGAMGIAVVEPRLCLTSGH